MGAAEYVVIDGNRRLKAAAVAGLAELRIDVNDDLAATAADLLESALIANVHRVDVPPLDQAKAVQQLVGVHGSQGKVAKRLGKTPAWVSQRLALLELTPDLQSAVETGELKVEPARRIGRLPKEQQAPAATAPAPQTSIVIPDVSPESIVAALKEQLSSQDLTKVAELLMESLTESATG